LPGLASTLVPMGVVIRAAMACDAAFLEDMLVEAANAPSHPDRGRAETLADPAIAHYVEGWRIPAPDMVVAMPRTVKIPAEGTMPYQNFVIDPKLKQDVWVRASQVRPGNPSVVHHLVVFVLPVCARPAAHGWL